MKTNWVLVVAIGLLGPPVATGVLALIAVLVARITGKELAQDQLLFGAPFVWGLCQVLVLFLIWRGYWLYGRRDEEEGRRAN